MGRNQIEVKWEINYKLQIDNVDSNYIFPPNL